MKIVKNNAKKLLSIAIFASSILALNSVYANTTALFTAFKESLNIKFETEEVFTYGVKDIRPTTQTNRAIDKQWDIALALFESNTGWDKIAQCITKDNIRTTNPYLIKKLIKYVYSEDLAEIFASYLIHHKMTGFLSDTLEHILDAKYLDAKKELAENCAFSISSKTINEVQPETIRLLLLYGPNNLTKYFTQCVTKDNFSAIDGRIIHQLIENDRSLIPTFAKYVTKDNFPQVDGFTIASILLGCKNEAQRSTLVNSFAKYVTKDNFPLIHSTTILQLIGNKDLIKTFSRHINKTNIQQINPFTIKHLLDANPSLAQSFASYISKKNFLLMDSSSIYVLLNTDPSLAQSFASCITKDSFQQIDIRTVEYLLDADKTVAQTLARHVNKESFYKNPNIIKILLDHDYKKESFYKNLNIIKFFLDRDYEVAHLLTQFIPKSNLGLDHFIWNTQLLSNILKIHSHTQDKGIQLSLQKATRSHQHFTTTHEAVLDMFSSRLKNDPNLTETLFKVVGREELELQNGRYTIAHGRKDNRFVRDQVWTWLKEIESQQPIDRASWYPMHWKTNGKSMPYNNVAEVIKHGRGSTEDRKSVQFASDLFGCKGGSSALDYVLRNDNVDNYSTQENIEKLFEYFGWEKYYKLGAKYFERAEELAKQMKYGTLLLYSFTPEALERFAFVTHKSGAGKGDITLLTPDGQEFRTSSPKVVLDRLLHNPESFKFKEKKYEYVIAVCDDDTKDKTKLGTQNPFNQELRTYHFNFGKDQQLATEIKRLVAAGFMQIIPAMIKDKVITKELACELVKANPVFKQKSRL